MQHELRADFLPVTNDSSDFWNGCADGQLLLRHCTLCELLFHYPRLCCPRCGGQALDWRVAAGTGVVYSHTTVHVPFNGPEWSDQLPYTVLLVELSEGPKMLSRLAPGESGDVHSGDRVVVEFFTIGERTLPLFRLDQR